MLILGLNAYHADSAACLVCDGELIAAAEEERFRRIKHWAGLPTQAIRYCLEEAKIHVGEIDHVAINRKPRASPCRRVLFLLRHRPKVGLVWTRIWNLFAVRSIPRVLGSFPGNESFRGKVHYIEHHRAHLASAYLASGFSRAACVSVDGCGDFTSTAWGEGNGDITLGGRIYFPHSLGIFYSAITQLLGFDSFGDEYKVMGLAAYGQPSYMEHLRRVLQVQSNGLFRLELKYFRHHTENVCYRWEDCAPEVGPLYTPELERLLGSGRRKDEALEQRHKDIACSLQAVYEEVFFSLLNAVYQKYPYRHLALAGGCAMNSLANGKIHLQTRFEEIYVPPAAGDAGGAIGAALAVWQNAKRTEGCRHEMQQAVHTQETPENGINLSSFESTVHPRHHALGIPHHKHAYAGPQFGDLSVAHLLQSRGLIPNHVNVSALAAQCATICFTTDKFQISRVSDAQELCSRAARAIANGQIMGCFQGRMEWGPRALGNRSILCDPRRADIRETLNAKIKRREAFRPFAPSILRAHVKEWFETEGDIPFMTAVYQVRAEKRALIPAVTHVDGSGRLQTVDQAMNPFLHRLILEFHSLTAVPMLLNTSFNEQEPIVCRPEEALDCFLRTRMDVLVLGGFLISR